MLKRTFPDEVFFPLHSADKRYQIPVTITKGVVLKVISSSLY